MFGAGRGVKVGQVEERENDKICPEPTELDAGRIRAAPRRAFA